MACTTYLFLIWLVYFQASMNQASAHTSRTTNTSFVNEKIPKECQAMGYCEFSEKYPKALLAKLVRELVEARVPLDSDVNDTIPSLQIRISSIDTSEATCDHITKTITPLIIRDLTDGNWYYAVNTEKDPIQKYNVQICPESSPGEPAQECSSKINFKNDYKSRCIQKFITRKVQVVKDGKPHPILGKIPCCCSCVVVNKYH